MEALALEPPMVADLFSVKFRCLFVAVGTAAALVVAADAVTVFVLPKPPLSAVLCGMADFLLESESNLLV